MHVTIPSAKRHFPHISPIVKHFCQRIVPGGDIDVMGTDPSNEWVKKTEYVCA
jgi:hypothetical protein